MNRIRKKVLKIIRMENMKQVIEHRISVSLKAQELTRKKSLIFYLKTLYQQVIHSYFCIKKIIIEGMANKASNTDHIIQAMVGLSQLELNSQSIRQQLHDKIQIFYPKVYDSLYLHGQPINHYYFLLKGQVLLSRIQYSKGLNSSYETFSQTQKLNTPGVIGQYYSSHNRMRIYSAIVQQQSTEIIKISTENFHHIFHRYISEKLKLQQYASNQFKIPLNELNPEIFTIRKYMIHQEVQRPILAIILNGSCKISARNITKEQTQNNQQKKKTLFPQLVKFSLRQMREIMVIGENQWIGIEQLFKNQTSFKYIATSSSLQIMEMPLSFVLEQLPVYKNRLLNKIYQERKKRLIQIEVKHTRIDLSQEKNKIKREIKAQDILNGIDPALSPRLIRQKYRLGHSKINYDFNPKKQRNSLGVGEFSPSIRMREKLERKTDIKSQNRDWSHYIKRQLKNPTTFNIR